MKEARPRFDVALQLSPFASADIAPHAVTLERKLEIFGTC